MLFWTIDMFALSNIETIQMTSNVGAMRVQRTRVAASAAVPAPPMCVTLMSASPFARSVAAFSLGSEVASGAPPCQIASGRKSLCFEVDAHE